MIYDIRKKLSNKRPEVIFDDEHKFKINDTKNGVLIMQQMIKEVNDKSDKKRDEHKKALKEWEEKVKENPEIEKPVLDEIQLMKDQYEGFDNVIGFMLGNEAKEYIKANEDELSLSYYNTIFNVIGAAIAGKSLEDFEKEQAEKKEEFR